MAEETRHIDISNLPDLLRIAEEVNKVGQPYILQEHNREIAMITPLSIDKKHSKKQAKSQQHYEAFLAAAGSLKGIEDVEKFKADVYESRRLSTRPPVEL